MPIHRLIDGALKPYTDEEAAEITLAARRTGERPPAGRAVLVVPNDVKIDEIADILHEFAAIILEFPVFRDGRAYSQARLLRERYGYDGEIRARGNVLRDQAQFMRRAGFDAFELDDAHGDGFAEALDDFSFVYQPAADAAEPVWRLRAARAVAA